MTRLEKDDESEEVDEDVSLCAAAVTQFVKSPAFEAVIIFTIAWNAVAMAVVGPSPEPHTLMAGVGYWTSLLSLPIYTVEALLRMYGLGLWRNSQSYFRDPWSIFDFIVLMGSFVDLAVSQSLNEGDSAGSVNIMVLRLLRFVRVFRILKGASRIQASRTILETIIKGFYMSRYVFVFIGFFVVLCATLGLSWFKSNLRNKCVVDPQTLQPPPYALSETQRLDLQTSASTSIAWDSIVGQSPVMLQPPVYCAFSQSHLDMWGSGCGPGNMCVTVSYPTGGGLVNFEHFGNAVLSVIIAMLQQDYEEEMLATMQSTTPLAGLFFVVIIVLGGLFLMNYSTAVICLAYTQVRKEMEEGSEEERQNRTKTLLLQLGLDHADERREQEMSAKGKDNENGEDGQKRHSGGSMSTPAHKRIIGSPVPPPTRVSSTQGVKTASSSTKFNSAKKRNSPPGVPKGGVLSPTMTMSARKRRSGGVEREDVKLNCEGEEEDRSYPLLQGGHRNQQSLERIWERSNQWHGVAGNKLVRKARYAYDIFCYYVAGIVMYPLMPSEKHGAGRVCQFDGADNITGELAYWEIFMSIIAALDAGFLLGDASGRATVIQSTGLAPERPSISEDYGHFAILGVFVLDFFIKLFAYKGFHHYVRSSLNVLDMMSTGAILIAELVGPTRCPSLRGLRVIRIGTVLCLGKRWSNFYKVASPPGGLGYGLTAVALPLFFIMMLAITGQQMFGGANVDGSGQERSFFGTFYLAFVSMIQLATQDKLLEMLDQGLSVGPHTVVFLIVTCLLLNVVFLKLMIAIFHFHFELPESFKIKYQLKLAEQLGDQFAVAWDPKHSDAHRKLLKEMLRPPPPPVRASTPPGIGYISRTGSNESNRSNKHHHHHHHQPKKGILSSMMGEVTGALDTVISPRKLEFTAALTATQKASTTCAATPRAAALRIVRSPFFDPVIGLFIIAATVCAVICPAVGCPPDILPITSAFNWIFIAVFTGEVLIKITALGWIRGPESYLRNPWHYLDLVCVIGMWVDVSGIVDVSGLATIRLLRILRLLAMVLTFESVRAAYQGLAVAMEEVILIALIVFMNILVFVSVSMQMYGGMYASCSHAGDANTRESCVGAGLAYLTYIHNGDTMISVPRTWESPDGNFDDFEHALLSSISTFLNLGWAPLLNSAMSVVGPGEQPARDTSAIYSLPIVLFQIVNVVVIWQLVVAVIVKSLRAGDGSAVQTESQQAWRATCRVAHARYMNKRQDKHDEGWSMAKALVSSSVFTNFINLTIALNIGTILSEHYGQPREMESVTMWINAACLAVYYVEMISQILAESHHYFLNVENLFDCFVNIVSTVDLFAAMMGDGSSAGMQALRVLRVLRIVRMAKRNHAVGMLLTTTIKSLTKSMGVYAIWLAVTVCFSVLTSQLFGHLKEGLYVNRYLGGGTFETIQGSLMWLFRIAVGTSLLDVLSDITIVEPGCTPSVAGELVGDCSPGIVAPIVVLFYAFLCRFLLIPLITATLVNTFFDTIDDMRSLVTEDELGRYEMCWDQLDPDGTCFIASWKFRPLLDRLATARSDLWIDPEKDGGEVVRCIRDRLEEKMEAERLLLNQQRHSALFSLIPERFFKKDPGLLPGVLRFDVVLQELAATRYHSSSLPNVTGGNADVIDRICSQCFANAQILIISTIRRQTLKAKRKKSMTITPGAVSRRTLASLPEGDPSKEGSVVQNGEKEEEEGNGGITAAALGQHMKTCGVGGGSMINHRRFEIEWLMHASLYPPEEDHVLPRAMAGSNLWERNYEKNTGQFNMEEVIRSGVPHITVDAWIKRHMDRAHDEHNITPRRLDGDEDRRSHEGESPAVASVADATHGIGSIAGPLTARRASVVGSQIVSLVLSVGQGGVPDGHEIEQDVIMALDTEPDRIKVTNVLYVGEITSFVKGGAMLSSRGSATNNGLCVVEVECRGGEGNEGTPNLAECLIRQSYDTFSDLRTVIPRLKDCLGMSATQAVEEIETVEAIKMASPSSRMQSTPGSKTRRSTRTARGVSASPGATGTAGDSPVEATPDSGRRRLVPATPVLASRIKPGMDEGGDATNRSSFFRSKRGGGLVYVSPSKDIADDFMDQIVGGINDIERGFGDVMNGGREGGREEGMGTVAETPSRGGVRFSTQVGAGGVEAGTQEDGGLIGSIRKFIGGQEGDFGSNGGVDVPGDQRTDRDLITSIRLLMGGKEEE